MIVLLDKLMLALKAMQVWVEQRIAAISEQFEQEIKDVSEQIVSPDWNQNDSAAADYIKNRPFYKKSEGKTIVETQSIDLLGGYLEGKSFSHDGSIKIGDRITVIWDDITYDLTVGEHYYTLYPAVGYYVDRDESYPFTVTFDSGSIGIEGRNGSETVNFGILIPGEIVKIPSEYLPETIIIDDSLNAESVNPVQNSVITNELNQINNKIGRVETIPGGVSGGDWSYCSNSIPTINDMIGSIVFGDKEFGGAFEIKISKSDITEYEWGFSFKYGFVVSSTPAEFGGQTWDQTGIYIGDYDAYLDDHYNMVYCSYDLIIYYKIASELLPDFSSDAVQYTAQELTEEQQIQVRQNIGIPTVEGKDYIIKKDYIILTDIVNSCDYIIQMQNGNLVSFSPCTGIEVTTMPTKISYKVGQEEFDPSGMVITAYCEDGTIRQVDNYEYDSLTESNLRSFEIRYSEMGEVYSTTITLYIDLSEELIDFEYNLESDGTYTLTKWKETLNGKPSTELIIPDNKFINL